MNSLFFYNGAPRKIHFMGVGGIGVSALAELAHAAGAQVSGCDPAENEQTRHLAERGILVFKGHDSAHVKNCDCVVHTGAVSADHPEIMAAKRVYRRGEFFAEAVADSDLIGVAGAHGKTTTTWLIAKIFIATGKDPTVLLGGVSAELNGNFRQGFSRLAIGELDESDGSFLLPKVTVGVITNVEPEHLAFYQTFAEVEKVFSRFAEQIFPQNFLVANVDNAATAKIFAARIGEKRSYGFAKNADWQIREITRDSCGSRDGGKQIATIYFRGERRGQLKLPLIGKHNLQNALAALAVADLHGIKFDEATAALAECSGVKRRWEKLGLHNGAEIFSDYAHHPTEVRATLSGAKEIYRDKMLVIFQPHLFSRTRDHAAEFAQVLQIADKIALVEIYPAREKPIAGVDANLIIDAIPSEKLAYPRPLTASAAVEFAKESAGQFSLIVLMGAGDLDEIARRKFSEQADGIPSNSIRNF